MTKDAAQRSRWTFYEAVIFNRARFYSIWELKRLVTKVAPEAIIDWASVLVLPMSVQPYFAALERRLSFRRNPLWAFLGMAVSMKEEGNRAKTRKEVKEWFSTGF